MSSVKKHRPLRLYFILAGLSLPVIWIPTIQQLMGKGEAAFDLRTWVILSILASLGIILLFLILFLFTEYRRR